jgi:GTP-binding protein HflX
MGTGKPSDTNEQRERAVLVSVRWGETGLEEAEESLQELRSLAETAGAAMIDALLQMRSKPDPATLLGKGKLEELSDKVSESGADLVVFDQELTPSQQRNLENKLGIKVVDRTALILDIFALHAHSKEGKAQVEMAQLRYGLTRLTGKGAELSRLGGGIGTRGPGETKLEVDRRRINVRIKTLDRELKDLTRVRRVKRKRRDRQSIPTFALVGYTNAGKSSLLNSLTDAGVVVEDQLFSTLDPITRRIILAGNRRAVITDTVGFINHLPHQLVEAFKSTLEEVKEADVLLHVIDASSPSIRAKMSAVDEVLDELEAGDMPTLYVMNKMDLLGEDERRGLLKRIPYVVPTSTVTGEGLDLLREKMASSLSSSRTVSLFIPHRQGDLLSLLYRRGQVLDFRQEEKGFYLVVDMPESLFYRYRGYTVESEAPVKAGERIPEKPVNPV